MQTRAVKLLRKHEAAAYLGIKWRKLDYMRENRQIPFVKIGKLVLFLQADLDKFIQAHRFSAEKGGARMSGPLERDAVHTKHTPGGAQKQDGAFYTLGQVHYVRSLSRLKSASIPEGHVLVHNHVVHTTTTLCGVRGFRAWVQKLVPRLAPCGCGWAGLPHYQVVRNGVRYWP